MKARFSSGDNPEVIACRPESMVCYCQCVVAPACVPAPCLQRQRDRLQLTSKPISTLTPKITGDLATQLEVPN